MGSTYWNSGHGSQAERRSSACRLGADVWKVDLRRAIRSRVAHVAGYSSEIRTLRSSPTIVVSAVSQ